MNAEMKAWPCLKRNETLSLDEWLIRAKMKNANNVYIIDTVLLDKDEQVCHARL